MSRSRRHTPITGITTARSEAYDKRRWHKRFRVLARSRDIELTDERLVSDPWSMQKDGKKWWNPALFKRHPSLVWHDKPFRFWMK